MRIAVGLVSILFLIAGCSTTDDLHPELKGERVGVNASYETVWKAAHAALSKRFETVDGDLETGVVRGHNGIKLLYDIKVSPWSQAVGIFIWPTEDSDNGYFVGVDAQQSWWHPDNVYKRKVPDWKKDLIKDIEAKLVKS